MDDWREKSHVSHKGISCSLKKEENPGAGGYSSVVEHILSTGEVMG
jgi:hypothetical protein